MDMSVDLTNLSIKELQRLRSSASYEISRYKNIQLARKVQLNAAYGALG